MIWILCLIFFFEIIQFRYLVSKIERFNDIYDKYHGNNWIHKIDEDDWIHKDKEREESVVKYLEFMFDCDEYVLHSIRFLTNKSHYKDDYENKVLLFYLNLSTCDVRDISGVKTYRFRNNMPNDK